MQPTVTIKRLGWLAAATIVLGVLIGVGAGLLTLLLYGVEHVLLGYIEGPELPGPFGVPAARRAISVTVGLSIAGIIWYLMRHKTTAVPSVKKAVAGKRMLFWQTIAHVVLQIFIVGSGASIGREVAPRELGAMLAQRFCDLFHIEGVDGIDRRMVVAVAAGAGRCDNRKSCVWTGHVCHCRIRGGCDQRASPVLRHYRHATGIHANVNGVRSDLRCGMWSGRRIVPKRFAMGGSAQANR